MDPTDNNPLDIQPAAPSKRIWPIVFVVLLVVVIGVVAVVVLRSPEDSADQGVFEIIEDPSLLYNPEGDREALERNITGADRQFLYSQRGTFIRLENDLIYFRIENSTETDAGIYVNVTERAGKLAPNISITSFTPDPNDPSAVLSRPATIQDIRPSDIIVVRTYQNILATDDFTIEEIDIIY